MNRTSSMFRRGAWVATLACFAAGALAQDEGQPGGERDKVPDLTRGAQPSTPQDELVRLFGEVERNLRATDAMLWEAGAGEIPLGQPADSGLADLLRSAQGNAREALSAIDQILRIAEEQASQSPSGSSGNPQQGQEPKPGSQQQDGQPQGDAERTPEAQQQPEQGQGQDQEQPGQQDPQPGPEQPDPDDQNEQGALREEQTGPRALPGTEADRWGELPQRVREIFRTEGGGEMPAQYRDWIDAYYRRLNRGH